MSLTNLPQQRLSVSAWASPSSSVLSPLRCAAGLLARILADRISMGDEGRCPHHAAVSSEHINVQTRPLTCTYTTLACRAADQDPGRPLPLGDEGCHPHHAGAAHRQGRHRTQALRAPAADHLRQVPGRPGELDKYHAGSLDLRAQHSITMCICVCSSARAALHSRRHCIQALVPQLQTTFMKCLATKQAGESLPSQLFRTQLSLSQTAKAALELTWLGFSNNTQIGCIVMYRRARAFWSRTAQRAQRMRRHSCMQQADVVDDLWSRRTSELGWAEHLVLSRCRWLCRHVQ